MLHITMRRLGFATLALLCATLLMQALANGGVASRSLDARVVNGDLNLASWDPERDGEIELEGDWKFEWRTFLEPIEVSTRFTQLDTTLEVPGLWRESGYPLHGYGTYALRVSELPNDSLSLTMQRITSAATLYVFDEIRGTTIKVDYGTPGTDAKTEVPVSNLVRTIELRNLGQRDGKASLLFVMHVSNFHHARGGTKAGLSIDTIRQASRFAFQTTLRSQLLLGALLILSLYHFVAFCLNTSRPAQLYFALFCFFMGSREFSLSGMTDLLGIDATHAVFSALYKVEYASVPLVITAALFLVENILPSRRFRDFAVLLGLVFGGAVTGFILLSEPATFTNHRYLLELNIVLAAIGGIGYLLTQALSGHKQAVELLGAVAILALGAFNDILYNNQVIHTAYVSSYSVMVFALIQALLLARETRRLESEKNHLHSTTLAQANEISLGQQHARELTDARLQAENSLRLEAESAVLLFSNAVHHLNNPLNHVLGATLYVNHITNEVRSLLNELLATDPIDSETEQVRLRFDEQLSTAGDNLKIITHASERMALSVSLLRELSGIDGTAMEQHSIDKLLKRLQSNPNIDITGQDLEAKDLTLYGSVSIYAYVTEYLIETARQVYDTDFGLRIDCRSDSKPMLVVTPTVMDHEEAEPGDRVPESPADPLIQAANLVNYILKRYGGHVELAGRELQVILPTQPISEAPGLGHVGL